MAKLFSKSTPAPAPVSRRGELAKQDAALLARQLELEGAGVTPDASPGRADIEARALELLGGDVSAQPAQSRGAELVAIYAERAALKRAIELLDNEEFDARLAKQRAAIEAAKPEWREAVRQRVRAVVALQAADAACNALRARLNGPGGLPSYACSGFAVPKITCTHKQFLNAAIAAGFITESELTKWH